MLRVRLHCFTSLILAVFMGHSVSLRGVDQLQHSLDNPDSTSIGNTNKRYVDENALKRRQFVTAEVDYSKEKATDELINAEICVVAVGSIVALGKIAASSATVLEKIEKAIKAAKTIEEKSGALIKLVAEKFGAKLGEETSKWIVTKFIAGSEGIGLAVLCKKLLETCWDGAKGVGRAVKDGAVLGTELIQGKEPVNLMNGIAKGAFRKDGPQAMALTCWNNASRGVFTSKREEAQQCCDAKFPRGNDRSACRNHVNNIADDSGW